MKLEFSAQIFEKSTDREFHENPSIGSRAVPQGKTDGQTDMTKMETTNSHARREKILFRISGALGGGLCSRHG
jgi:hypothetical protein